MFLQTVHSSNFKCSFPESIGRFMIQKTTTAPATPDPAEESSPSPIGSNYTTASESGAVDILDDQKGVNDDVSETKLKKNHQILQSRLKLPPSPLK